MKTKKPQVKLISHTRLPLETLFAVWAQSRPTQYPNLFKFALSVGSSVITADIVDAARDARVVSDNDIKYVVSKVASMSIPVAESIHFTWGFANLPIEWREQAVRKRQLGFWLTSMREFGMDDFVTEGRVSFPEGLTEEQEFMLDGALEDIERVYNKLKYHGVPQEVARKVIPLCATHNGSMFMNFRALLELLAARSCWIAQLTLWKPVLLGMVEELEKIDPVFKALVSPPCFDKGCEDYKECKYKEINENRLTGKDPYACCPLYWSNEKRLPTSALQHCDDWVLTMREAGVRESYIYQGLRLGEAWRKVWARDIFTGELT